MDFSTKISKISFQSPEADKIKEAAKIINSGGLVVFPTETVYGLGANALDKEASSKIYLAKGRPSDNPLIVHISKIEELYQIAKDISEDALKLADKFWPGPLTMILPKSDIVPLETTGGLLTVAVRMPSNPIARELIKQSHIPIAAPSANISGRPSPTRISHVIEDMNNRVDMIIDGGDVDLGLESTIVDLTSDVISILRCGFITKEELESTLEKPVKGRDKNTKEVQKPKAPGMKYRHYAPKGEIFIINGEKNSVVKKINELISSNLKEGKNVAVIGTEENKGAFENAIFYSVGRRSNGAQIAGNLYDVLHRMDIDNVDIAFSESFYDIEHGDAIMERMEKAAEYRFINV